MIATKTIAALLRKEYRKRKKENKNINWFALAYVVRTAVVKSLKKKKAANSVVNLRRVGG